MDLTKLFETQKILRDRIGYNEPDRFNKLILALLVELGECANEWRGFKFWSKNQEPRTIVEYGICKRCCGLGFLEDTQEDCPVPNCVDGELTKNPLLEEYVDGLHFILELGLELFEKGLLKELPETINAIHKWIELDITGQFKQVYWITIKLEIAVANEPTRAALEYDCLFNDYLTLGEKLGFTENQIIDSYYAKNQINHQRQDSGVY